MTENVSYYRVSLPALAASAVKAFFRCSWKRGIRDTAALLVHDAVHVGAPDHRLYGDPALAVQRRHRR